MPLIIIPLAVAIINESVKCILQSIKYKKFDIRWMFHSWWMSSWHSALVTSVITVTFLRNWPWGIEFMIATAFGLLIMYDARWIRRQTWIHAKMLNQLQSKIKFDECLGHSDSEVATWALLWAVCSYLMWTLLLI